jgi:hypothetical protein
VTQRDKKNLLEISPFLLWVTWAIIWIICNGHEGRCSAYDEAFTAIQTATYKQTGAEKLVSDLGNYGKNKLYNTANFLGIRNEINACAGLFYLYKARQFVIPIKNKTLILKTDRLELEIHI